VADRRPAAAPVDTKTPKAAPPAKSGAPSTGATGQSGATGPAQGKDDGLLNYLLGGSQ
jgi:hypothetical protein